MDDPRGVRSFSARLRNSSNRPGRWFYPTREFFRCSGKCIRIIQIYCLPISTTIRKAATLGTSYARKPLYSREGANIELIRNGRAVDQDDGPYGAEGYVRQAIAELPQFDGNYTVLGAWFSAGAPCGLSVREDSSPITKNTSRRLPHAIVE